MQAADLNVLLACQGWIKQGRKAVLIAVGGVYDPRIHLDDVVMPVLKKWRIFEREDFSPVGEQRREQLAAYLTRLEGEVLKFEEQRDRLLARDARKKELQST